MAETQKNLEAVLKDKQLIEKWANFLEVDPETLPQDINKDFSNLKGAAEKEEFIKLLEQGPESFKKTIHEIGDEVIKLEGRLGG